MCNRKGTEKNRREVTGKRKSTGFFHYATIGIHHRTLTSKVDKSIRISSDSVHC